MTGKTRIHSASTVDGGVVDVVVDSSTGLIESVWPEGTHRDDPGDRDDPRDGAVIDARGHLITTGFVEPHAHMDKAFLADRVDNPEGDLMGAIIGLDAIRDTITFDDIVARATRAATWMSRNGVTAVRTHADTTLAGGLVPLLALLEAKRRCADFIDIQVAALIEWPLVGPDGQKRRALAREAVAAGAQVIGGCPHLDQDPRSALEFLFELAHEHGVPLDIHADENMRPDSRDLEMMCELAAKGASVAINASHCVALTVREPDAARAIADSTAAAGITVTVLPQTNLFLQSRGTGLSAPRAIAPVSLLRDAGVTVAAGADNVQDPFNPVGRLDPLETASLLVMAAHQDTHDAMSMVTHEASKVLGHRSASIAAGSPATFVLTPAVNTREAIAMGPSDRIVFFGGRRVTVDDHHDAMDR